MLIETGEIKTGKPLKTPQKRRCKRKKLTGNKSPLRHRVYATCNAGDGENKTLLLIYLIKFHAATAAAI